MFSFFILFVVKEVNVKYTYRYPISIVMTGVNEMHFSMYVILLLIA